MCQAMRATITVTSTAAATTMYRPCSDASRLARIGRTCRPMKMNARMFSAKTAVSHTA
jgi:hypothetical protein